ncbi:MAG: lytic transglycosylase domain-containing protein [Deltaproteobacteria bacterium]|nr:lytic transglycosylase domain-containing protein [Deltaproteobacteria bacterium]
MFQQIFEKRKLKEIAGIMILLNSIVIILSLSMIYMNSKAVKDVHKEIVELKAKVEEEIKLREELFITLRKSASLLKEYNPRLGEVTAFRYACKIYECSQHPVTPELLTALIVVESSANHIAVSKKGAVGLTQVMPRIWQINKKELFNPYKNIEVGSEILKYYIDKHGIKGGLSSYNSGKKNRSLRYARYVIKVAENLQKSDF